MQVVRNGKKIPNKVHKCNAIQGPLEHIKALSANKREMFIYKIRRTSQWPNNDVTI